MLTTTTDAAPSGAAVTRRAILAGTPAAIAAAGLTAIPAVASTGSNDRRLRDLFRQLPVAWERYIEAEERASDCLSAADREEFPELPAVGDDAQCSLSAGPDFWPNAREEIEETFQGGQRARMLTLHEEWTARSMAILERRGWPALNQVATAALTTIRGIEQAIIATPADTYVGILAKVQLLHERLGGVLDDNNPHSVGGAEGVIRSIAKDVERLAGGAS